MWVKLSMGEINWLQRRRFGLTQPQIARVRHVSEHVVRAWEYEVGKAGQYELSIPEYNRLLRRRSGLTLEAAAACMGVSKVTFLKRERGATVLQWMYTHFGHDHGRV